MLLHELENRKLIHPPPYLTDNTQYLCIMGSQAYGVATEDSDFDVYGWVIPPKDMVFPHLAGEIQGFGRQIKKFEQWTEAHIFDPNALNGKGREYDFTVYNIVKYFHLVMENNPNMIDSLFVKNNCILHATHIAQMVRDQRKIFLHKGCWHKFKGYAYSQMHKAKSQTREGKRAEVVAKYGYDLKFAYHVVRLLNEVEQILLEHDLDLTRNNDQLKAIRNGDWKWEQVETYFNDKEKKLEQVYHDSKLSYGPPEEEIKTLLLQCLEHHYGSLDKAITIPGEEKKLLLQIKALVANV